MRRCCTAQRASTAENIVFCQSHAPFCRILLRCQNAFILLEILPALSAGPYMQTATIPFPRAYVFTVCSPLLALVRTVRCNLPRSRSVRIQHLSRCPSTVGRKSRSEVRACAYFVAGFHVRRTGLKRFLRCLAANVCCVQKSLKGSSLHTLSLVARLLEKTEEKNPSVLFPWSIASSYLYLLVFNNRQWVVWSGKLFSK